MIQLQSIFWNRAEGRLRALWRITLYFILWILCSRILDWIFIPPLARAWVALGYGNIGWIEHGIHFALYLVTIVIVTYFAAHFIDRRSVRKLGMQLDRAWWVELAAGLVLGAMLMSAIFVLVWSLGWIRVNNIFAVIAPGIPFWIAISGALFVFIVIGFTEELMFRGYVLRNCAEAIGGLGLPVRGAVVFGWLASSALFGIFHILNPNATWTSTLYLAFAGMMLGLPMVLTGRLGMPIGLHIAWNFVQGNIYGFPVSGNDFSRVTVFETVTDGPDLWTGGTFGPEAGLLGILAISLGMVLITWWLHSRYGVLRIERDLAIFVDRRKPPIAPLG